MYFYVVLRARTLPTLFFWIKLLRKTVSATFQPSELHNNLCRPLSIPQKTCVGNFPTLRPQIELCRSLSNPQKNIVGQLTTLFFSVIFEPKVSANLRFPVEHTTQCLSLETDLDDYRLPICHKLSLCLAPLFVLSQIGYIFHACTTERWECNPVLLLII